MDSKIFIGYYLLIVNDNIPHNRKNFNEPRPDFRPVEVHCFMHDYNLHYFFIINYSSIIIYNIFFLNLSKKHLFVPKNS